MTVTGFLELLRSGDLIIVPGGGEKPLHASAHAVPHGRPGAQRGKTPGSRRLRTLISFRKEGKKK